MKKKAKEKKKAVAQDAIQINFRLTELYGHDGEIDEGSSNNRYYSLSWPPLEELIDYKNFYKRKLYKIKWGSSGGDIVAMKFVNRKG